MRRHEERDALRASCYQVTSERQPRSEVVEPNEIVFGALERRYVAVYEDDWNVQ